nr:hypothetical protein [Trichoderma atroviride]
MSIMAPPDVATTIRYRPLDRSGNEVRLLELQPPTTNDISERVVCRLVHEKLSDASNFIGLSALYGDITATETILLNGASITIPSHLVQALQYMRVVFLAASLPTPDASTTDLPGPAAMPPPPLPTPPKKAPGWLRSLLKGVRQMLAEPGVPKGSPPLRIWLDLLCINPRDAREEAERRAHMARAYHHAKMVVGWLGEKDSTSDLAIEIIKAWDKVMPRTFGEPGDREAHPENYAPFMKWMAPVAHLSDIPEGIKDARDVPAYVAISGFLNRPYFRNSWILDDMSKARFPAFLLGDDIVSWMQILRLNRANEEIRDNGAEMFPDELRPLLEYLPLGSVYAFLKDFDNRQRMEGDRSQPITASVESFLALHKAICTNIHERRNEYAAVIASGADHHHIVEDHQNYVLQPLFEALVLVIGPGNWKGEDSTLIGRLPVTMARTGVETGLSSPITFEPIVDRIDEYIGSRDNIGDCYYLCDGTGSPRNRCVWSAARSDCLMGSGLFFPPMARYNAI